MRSPTNAVPAWSVVLLLATAAAPVLSGEDTLPLAPGAIPTTQQIDAALVDLRLDPNLPQERTVRSLRWRQDDQARTPDETPGWILWMQGLFGWIAGSARALTWVVIALLVAMIAVFVIRLLRAGRTGRLDAGFIAPTHVRDLDIRPDSLPADIGLAARTLWDAGAQRQALALLYRGLLSRLAHQHQAPVRDSTTEGQSVVLAQRHLSTPAAGFAAQLVTSWQNAVYGDNMPPTAAVHALCADFRAALDVAAADAVDRPAP